MRPSKTRLFQTHIEEFSSIFDSSGSQFFRTTNRIHSEIDILQKYTLDLSQQD